MGNFDLYNKRVSTRGTTMMDRMIADKQSSFLTALERSYNSETVTKGDGQFFKALLADDKVSMDTDQKTISIPSEAGFKVGDVFLWDRTDTHWLIYTQNLTERSYFKGEIKKAGYKIRWRNGNGIVFEQWAYIKGPEGDEIKDESEKTVTVEVPNDTLVVSLTSTEGTKCFDKHFKIMIKDKVWEVTSVNDIGAPGITTIGLKEYYLDSQVDDQVNEIAGGKTPIEFIVTSFLDTLTNAIVGSAIDINFSILKNGVPVTDINDIVITTNSQADVVQTDKLYLNTAGTSIVKVSIASIGFEKEYSINVDNALPSSITTYEIIGSEKVKAFGDQVYTIKKFVDGQILPGDGVWSIDSTVCADFKYQNADSVRLYMTGDTGTIILTYVTGLISVTKIIKVVSLFG